MDSVPSSVMVALTVAMESDADLQEVACVLQMGTAWVAVCDGGEDFSLATCVSSVVAPLRSLEPHARAQWVGVFGTLGTLAQLGGGGAAGSFSRGAGGGSGRAGRCGPHLGNEN